MRAICITRLSESKRQDRWNLLISSTHDRQKQVKRGHFVVSSTPLKVQIGQNWIRQIDILRHWYAMKMHIDLTNSIAVLANLNFKWCSAFHRQTSINFSDASRCSATRKTINIFHRQKYQLKKVVDRSSQAYLTSINLNDGISLK